MDWRGYNRGACDPSAPLSAPSPRANNRPMFWRNLLHAWLCILGLALAQPSFAAPPDPLAKALALPHASGLTGARNARTFAWVENKAGVRNVWVGGPGQTARQLTAFDQDDGVEVYDLALSDDGTSLAFVRGGDEEFPDEEDLPNPGPAPVAPGQQVFVMSVVGGAPRPIGDGHSPVFAPGGSRVVFTREGEIRLWEGGAEARRIAKVTGSVSRIRWSPDGQRLLFAEDRGEHGVVGLLDLAAARLRYLDPGLGQSVEPVFSPDGRQVAFIRSMSPPPGAAPDAGAYWSIRVADSATGTARELWAAPAGRGGRYYGTRSQNLFWSKEGLIVFPWERTGWIHAYALDTNAGGEPRALTSGSFELESFLLGPDGRSLLYAANVDEPDRRHIWSRPLRGGAAVRLTGGKGIESYPTLAGDALAVIATDASHPAYPALIGPGLKPIAQAHEAPGFVAPEAVTFRAEDGLQVRGQLFRGRGCSKCPALVYVHGGPRRQMVLGFHPSGYYSRAYIMNQHLAARGYNVLSVNYRSGTGYGLAFRDAPETAREGASEYRDVLAAGRWLAARADVDPARIGIWGGSWGGYLTALALARNSDLFAAGADFHGVHSLLRPVPNSLSPQAQERARQLQWNSSPIAAIERWRSPVLLVHGDDDRNVDFSQSLLLARELAARGIPFRELVFANERHTFLRHEDWLAGLLAADAFLAETVMRKQRPR
jgi:dipeptidyl aminopeptidase/acylaminoacyl peptidase